MVRHRKWLPRYAATFPLIASGLSTDAPYSRSQYSGEHIVPYKESSAFETVKGLVSEWYKTAGGVGTAVGGAYLAGSIPVPITVAAALGAAGAGYAHGDQGATNYVNSLDQCMTKVAQALTGERLPNWRTVESVGGCNSYAAIMNGQTAAHYVQAKRLEMNLDPGKRDNILKGVGYDADATRQALKELLEQPEYEALFKIIRSLGAVDKQVSKETLRELGLTTGLTTSRLRHMLMILKTFKDAKDFWTEVDTGLTIFEKERIKKETEKNEKNVSVIVTISQSPTWLALLAGTVLFGAAGGRKLKTWWYNTQAAREREARREARIKEIIDASRRESRIEIKCTDHDELVRLVKENAEQRMFVTLSRIIMHVNNQAARSSARFSTQVDEPLEVPSLFELRRMGGVETLEKIEDLVGSLLESTRLSEDVRKYLIACIANKLHNEESGRLVRRNRERHRAETITVSNLLAEMAKVETLVRQNTPESINKATDVWEKYVRLITHLEIDVELINVQSSYADPRILEDEIRHNIIKAAEARGKARDEMGTTLVGLLNAWLAQLKIIATPRQVSGVSAQKGAEILEKYNETKKTIESILRSSIPITAVPRESREILGHAHALMEAAPQRSGARLTRSSSPPRLMR